MSQSLTNGMGRIKENSFIPAPFAKVNGLEILDKYIDYLFMNEKDELFQYHYKNHLLEILHFVIPGHQCFISLADIHQQDLLI